MGGNITNCLKCGAWMHVGGKCEKCASDVIDNAHDQNPSAVYENKHDRLAQRAIMLSLETHFKSVDFVGHRFLLKERETVAQKQDHDVDVFFDGVRVGAIEIKNRSYPAEYFERNGYMISKQKLDYLWSLRHNNISAALAVLSSDDVIFKASLNHLMKHQSLWIRAGTEQMSRTDHGKRSRNIDDDGFVIPMNLFQRL